MSHFLKDCDLAHLTLEEEQKAIRKAKEGDQDAWMLLLRTHAAYILRRANKCKRFSKLTFDDLVSEGICGFGDALDRFDLNNGARLFSYAAYVINHRIYGAIQDEGYTVRVPQTWSEQYTKYDRARRVLTQRLQREPKRQEIKEYVSDFDSEVYDSEKTHRLIKSLDSKFDDSDSRSLLDVVSSTAERPDDAITAFEKKEEVLSYLEVLNERQKRVVRRYYGIAFEHAHTLQDIGNDEGVTKERVRQIRNEALEKLRVALGVEEADNSQDSEEIQETRGRSNNAIRYEEMPVLEQLMVSDKTSINEIAELFDVSVQTIYRYMSPEGIWRHEGYVQRREKEK
ncbi:hypothetical protein [Salisaeta icosahedral phage 1]|uniref:RNA polymerase sigma factor n=1 Tax=Salisaeta icosahedral phage 1 TaxID=1183239 RepID=UPI00025EA90F|nr:RNA polymerase sigma factor [Salisaeta icosahedral phage 1]AFJ21457.1 hypothetical protein [Salisaeta icosahedral phage 1]